MGSFVPWLYFGFYCSLQAKLIYLTVVVVLGICSIVVSLWDRFSLPRYRPLRAGECNWKEGVGGGGREFLPSHSIIVGIILIFSLSKGVFMIFGLHGVVPAVHHAISEGWFNAITQASLGWVILMGFLYILGALIYMLRVPERFFPGKCDIWVRSGEKIDNFRFFFFFDVFQIH